jgi:hypothetical protein
VELLLSLLVFILVFGLIYWLATQFLPHPIPLVILVIGVIVLLFWLVGAVDGAGTFGDGRR